VLALVLLLALVGWSLAGWRVGAEAGADTATDRAAIAATVLVAGTLSTTAIVGRAAHSLDAGLVACAVLGVAGAVWSRRAATAPVTPPGAGMVIAVCAMTALVGFIAVRYQMHDEFHVSPGHRMAVEQLRQGLYPIHLPMFPGVEPRYHYGFDVLAGSLARGWGLSTDWALDATTIALAAITSACAGSVAIAAGAPRAAPFAAVAVHLAAGLAWLLLAGEGVHPRCLMQYDHATCGLPLVRPQLSYFHQHPVAVGVPLALGSLRLLQAQLSKPSRAVLVATIGALAALSLGQIVYFALASMGAVAGWCWLALRRHAPWRSGLTVLGIVVAAVAIGALQGGMFQRPDVYRAGLLIGRWPPGYPQASLLEVGTFAIVNVGVSLVAIAAAARSRRFVVVSLAAMAVGGLLAPQVIDYPWSSDVKKLVSVASVAAAMCYALTLDSILEPRRWLRRASRLALLGGGLLTACYLVFPLPAPHAVYQPESKPRRIDPIVATVGRWFWSNGYARTEVIWAQRNIARALATESGLSTVGFDVDLRGVGVDPERLRALRTSYAAARDTMHPAALEALGVRWLVLSDEELDNLGSPARAALQGADHLAVVATFPSPKPRGRRRVWRVRDNPESGSR